MSMPWQPMHAFAENDRLSFTSAPTFIDVIGAMPWGEAFAAFWSSVNPHWSTKTDPDKIGPETARAGTATNSAPATASAAAAASTRRRWRSVIRRSVRDPGLDGGDVGRRQRAVGRHGRPGPADRPRVAPHLVDEVARLGV